MQVSTKGAPCKRVFAHSGSVNQFAPMKMLMIVASERETERERERERERDSFYVWSLQMSCMPWNCLSKIFLICREGWLSNDWSSWGTRQWTSSKDMVVWEIFGIHLHIRAAKATCCNVSKLYQTSLNVGGICYCSWPLLSLKILNPDNDANFE